MTAAVQWNDRVRRRLKLRDVDILLAVIQTGSMGKAAAALNMSQPAVSKAIAYLEHTLGVRLLDRSRQGVEPTPYGRALIKRGVAMFDELQPRENNFGSFAMDGIHAAGLAPRITVATTSSNLRGEMLATGRYLTMVPRYWVLLPRRHPSLRILPVDFPHTRLKVAIITLKNRSLSQATQLFIDSVRAITKPLAREK